VYFPYSFYALTGALGVCAGFGALDLKQVFSLFQWRLMAGAAYIVQGKGNADIHYKEKTLFGGEEAFDTNSLDIGGAGAVFMLLDAEFPALRLDKRKKTRLSLGMRKLFVLPWGYERILPGDSALPGGSAPSAGNLLHTVLLSGLSFHGSLYW
jgi:hypothetical protein